MKIRIVSDFHNEFESANPNVLVPPMPEDAEITLVVAGDLGVVRDMDTIHPYLINWSERFAHVIYIAGNHEFYGSEIYRADKDLNALCKEFENVHYAPIIGQVFTIDGVRFVCNPLFCKMQKNPAVMQLVKNSIADFQAIRIRRLGEDERYLTPEDYLSLYECAEDFIFHGLRLRPGEVTKRVVVTHWTPSFGSVPERFWGSPINDYFSNRMDHEISISQPEMWIHGHTHNAFDYYINNTRIVCNPRGYPFEQNSGFDPHLTVEV